MKIIIIGTAYPLRGAMAQLNAILAHYLSSNHSVEIISFTRQYPKLLFPGKTQIDPSKPLFDLRIKPMIDSLNPLTWLKAARYIRNEKPELIIFRYWLPFFAPCFGTIAKFAKRGTSTKVLFICDNVIPHERRPGDIVFTKYAFKQADYFIIQSNAVERDLLQFVPDARYRRVSHPIYEIFGEALPKDDARRILGISAKKVILYFGYVRPYKGLMVLIDAMKKIAESREQRADVLLLAVGEFYDSETKYRKRARDLNLESCIRFVSDYVPNDQVRLYFSAADVVVLPYLSATQSGITQIAYNFDKPVIATNVGGLAEVVIDDRTGFIVPPNDPKALANAIRRFYDQRKEEEFVANVKIEKKKYSWDNLVEAIEELIQ